mmetsp:Transcript_10333/g.26208  ORF Transcript_10333/g.26208 Transcript_10333/m.26208 type:complete len:259 (+) Transcript_10333:318-1094(+)
MFGLSPYHPPGQLLYAGFLQDEFVFEGVPQHALLHVVPDAPRRFIHFHGLATLETHFLQLGEIEPLGPLGRYFLVVTEHLEKPFHAPVQALDDSRAPVVHLPVVGHHACILVEGGADALGRGPLNVSAHETAEERFGEHLDRSWILLPRLYPLLLEGFHLRFFIQCHTAHRCLKERGWGLAPVDRLERARAVRTLPAAFGATPAVLAPGTRGGSGTTARTTGPRSGAIRPRSPAFAASFVGRPAAAAVGLGDALGACA